MADQLIRASRLINRHLGDDSGRMLCTRIYINAKSYRSWLLAQYAVDIIFLLVRFETQHTRRAAIWELRYDPPTNQGATRAPQKAPGTQQACTVPSETSLKGGYQ